MTVHCGQHRCWEPATWTITAGRPGGPGPYRTTAACNPHLAAVRRWAAASGPPTVVRIDGQDGPEQGELFEGAG